MTWFGMSWIEILGFVSGAACVLLAARQNIWNWPIGIANNIFYIIVFLRSGLYADSGLQVFYIVISIYGWWRWLHAETGALQQPVTRTRRQIWLVLAVLTPLAWAGLYQLLHRFTNSTVPLCDSLTTALSLTAQYMMGRKLIENWIVWIVADVIYIGLYIYKALYLTSALYAIFIVMCVMGYRGWRESLARTAAEEPALATQ